MRDKKYLPIPQIQIIIGVSIALIYLGYCENYYKGEDEMNIASVVAIVIALLSCAGGIWAQFLQFKKDAATIKDVKLDTTAIRPTVNNVDENVKKIRDEVVEKIVPDMSKLKGVDLLVDDYKYRERIRQEKSVNMCSKDILQGSIDLIFAENARLNQELTKEREKNQELRFLNQDLSKKIKEYSRNRNHGLER